MEKLLFVDGCIRGEASRTLRLASRLVSCCTANASVNMETVALPAHNLRPLDKAALQHRDACIASRAFEDPCFAFARQFAQADAVILAAPFWDLSFPSLVRVYLEQLCVTGLTFHYSQEGACIGDCRARRLVYVTTRGGIIGPDAPDLAQPYLRALCGMLGVKKFDCLAAEGLDIVGNDAETLLQRAEQQAETFAQSFWE